MGLRELARRWVRGRTLHSAAAEGDLAAIEQLLTNGTPVDHRDGNFWTALHYANTTEAVNCLLTHGADVNAQDNNGATPLYVASGLGKTECVRALLSNGARVHAKVRGTKAAGFTPLHAAAHGGHDGVIDELLRCGAAVDDQDDNGCTPLYVAAEHGHVAAARRLLIQGSQPDVSDSIGATPLHVAAGGGHPAVVRLLIHAGSAVDARVRTSQFEGYTPLLFVAVLSSENEECHNVTRDLLAAGADPNARGSDCETALLLASTRGNASLCQVLLAGGADIKSADRRGLTALHRSAAAGHLGIVTLLLEYGADPNTKDNEDGWTALHHAVSGKQIRDATAVGGVVGALLGAGADLHAADNNRRTPIALSEAVGSTGLRQVARGLGYNV